MVYSGGCKKNRHFKPRKNYRIKWLCLTQWENCPTIPKQQQQQQQQRLCFAREIWKLVFIFTNKHICQSLAFILFRNPQLRRAKNALSKTQRSRSWVTPTRDMGQTPEPTCTVHVHEHPHTPTQACTPYNAHLHLCTWMCTCNHTLSGFAHPLAPRPLVDHKMVLVGVALYFTNTLKIFVKEN